MLTLEEIQLPIAEHIKCYEAFIANTLKSESGYVRSICDYILATRGKQMRPLLVLLSASLQGQISDKSYMGASMVEMIHTASLIHDDVIDEAYVRRGAPSVNSLWRSHTAILIGDYIFARTYHTCMDNDGEKMLREVTRSIYEVCEGELMQTEQSEKLSMTRAIYDDIIYKKTASLIGAASAVGAISVDASAEHIEAMRRFGNLIGMAFQIKDDILDYSEMLVTGKPRCGDLRERKITLPMIYLLDNSTEPERKRLISHISNARSSEASIDYLSRAVVSGGGIEYAENCMNGYKNEAIEVLSAYQSSSICKSLEGFAEFVLTRDK